MLFRIGMPLTAAYFAEIGMFITDMVIVGRLGSNELAAVGLAGGLSETGQTGVEAGRGSPGVFGRLLAADAVAHQHGTGPPDRLRWKLPAWAPGEAGPTPLIVETQREGSQNLAA